MEYAHIVPIVNLFFAVACTFVADSRGGLPLVWFVLGLAFGPFAFAFAITAGKRCPNCESIVPKKAEVCRFCHQKME